MVQAIVILFNLQENSTEPEVQDCETVPDLAIDEAAEEDEVEISEGDEVIDLDDDDYIVMDADEFIEQAEEELRREKEEAEEEKSVEPEEEIVRDSIYSFESHTDSVLCCAFNPVRSTQVLTGGQDNAAYLFDYTIPDKVSKLSGHEDSVCSVCFNNNGDYCATIDMNGLILVWKTSNCKKVVEIQGPEEPEWIQFHPKGNLLLAAGNDFSIWSWTVPDGNPQPLMTGHTDNVTCGAITPSGKMLVTGSLDNTLKLWSLRNKELMHSVKAEENNWHQGGVECLDLFATNSLCVSGGRDGSVRLTNLKTHKVLSGYQHNSSNEEENCSVEAVAFNAVYSWIASASMNSSVILYDYAANRVRHELKHNGGVVRMKWHPNKVVLITACLDGCVYIWDGRDGKLLKQLNGHTDLILDMDVSIKGKTTTICTASDDRTCQVYQVEIWFVCFHPRDFDIKQSI